MSLLEWTAAGGLVLGLVSFRGIFVFRNRRRLKTVDEFYRSLAHPPFPTRDSWPTGEHP